MYFGLRFLYSDVSIMVPPDEQPPRKLLLTRVEEDDASGKQLIREIRKDVRNLNESNMGGKGDWKRDGSFVLIGITDNVYVYHHPSHASCSSVNYSHIESEFNISPIEHKLLAKENLEDCQHKNHYHLEPFFMDNCRLSQYYNIILQQSNDDEVTEVLTELTEIERRIEHGEKITDSEFIRPRGLPNNWDENDWTRTLHIGIRKTFKVDVTCSAGMPNTEFKQNLTLMRLGVSFADQQYFIFRGLPDIIIRKKNVLWLMPVPVPVLIMSVIPAVMKSQR